VGHIHRVLKLALGQALKWELINRNPADNVDPPALDLKPIETYGIDETAKIIAALRETPMLMPGLLAVLCGLRRGEIAALRWRNVDLAKPEVRVVEAAEQTRAGIRYKSPKSGKGRTVALSATMLEELRRHRAEQAEGLLKLGIRLSDETFVCAHADGSPMTPIYITQYWARAVRKTTLAHRRFHDLRHAHATHMLANGINPKIASERLGHSRVSITLDLYSHVMPGMQESAAELVDSALRAAMAEKPKSAS
jgi:integrase